MDIAQKKPAQGLTMQQSRDWLSELSSFSATPENIEEVIRNRLPGRVLSQLKASGVDDDGLASRANAMTKWCQEHGLIEKAEGFTPTHPHWRLSSAGRRMIASSLNARKTSEKAWDEVAGLLARALWNNVSDPSIAPLLITDIILFGSMTNPDQESYGDADVVVFSQYKGATAKDQEAVREAADLKARDVCGLSPKAIISGTDWDRLCLSNLRSSRNFLSFSSPSIFSQFDEDGAPATGFSLFGTAIAKDKAPITHMLAPDQEVALRLHDQFSAACTRLGLPWLPQALSGMLFDDAKMKQLAEVAVSPLIRRCATRLSTSLIQHSCGQMGGEALDFMPDDSTRAFWFASGHPAGIDPAFYACQSVNGSGVLAVGVASRAFRGSAVEIGKMWEASYRNAMNNSSLGKHERQILAREFNGDVAHRLDLVPGKECCKAPSQVIHAACYGNWDEVRAWVDRGGKPESWIGVGPPDDHSEPWSLLLGLIRANDRFSKPKKPSEWINSFVKAGFSLETTSKRGETIREQALRFGIAEQFDEGLSECQESLFGCSRSTGSALSSSIARRRSSVKVRPNYHSPTVC